MDMFNQWFAERFPDLYTREMVMAIVLLLVGATLWFIWKFFFSMFKHVIMAILVVALGGALYAYFRSPGEPVRPPEVGKHAYGVSSGRYLGVVQNVTPEGELGIRAPNGYITKYTRSRIELTDTIRPDEPSPTPAPTATPAKLRRPRPR